MLEKPASGQSVHVTTYRPDLDGLRALAVCAVIAFHIAHDALPGGYLGVDIFFVLSGYLITSIIWREALVGRFSLVTFYNRRVRRIMPALLFVLLATTLASIVLLLPLDLMGFARSALASLGFVANFYFWRDTNYFARGAEEKPLLHIWSLGVEEQFYLLFPLLLALLARRAQARATAIIALCLVASLVLNAVALRWGAALPAFYLLPTRAWELGAGALLAMTQREAAPGDGPARVAGLAGLALVGLALLAGNSLFGSTGIPDAVPAVLGTALLVWSGQSARTPTARLLSLRPVVFIGLISYSLYLWHWPVIVLLKYWRIDELELADVALALVLMVAAAILSWRYVERPFRSPSMPIARVYAATIAGALLVVALSVAILWQGGFPSRLSAEADRASRAVGTHYRCAIADYVYFDGSRGCVLNLPTRDPNDADVVVFGNSHAQMYAPLLADLLGEASLTGLLVPMNRCWPSAAQNVTEACRRLAERNLAKIAALPRARIVILATTWHNPEQPDQAAAGIAAALEDTVSRLHAAGKTVVLVGPLATPGWDVPSRLSRSIAFGRQLDEPLFRPQSAFDAAYAGMIAGFEARAQLIFVRPDQIQCRAGRCAYVADGEPLFTDGSHLSGNALPAFRPLFASALQRAAAHAKSGE